MLSGQPTSAFIDHIETAIETLVSAVAPADGRIGLFTNSPVLSTATLMTDLTQPTFAGYAEVPVTVGSVRGNAAGDEILPLGMQSFQPSGAVSPAVTVNGFYLVVGTVLWIAEYLTDAEGNLAPFTFTGPLSGLDIVTELYFRAQPLYGIGCTTCTSD